MDGLQSSITGDIGMSIYTNQQLISRAEQMTREELLNSMARILSIPVSNSMRQKLARAIIKEAPSEMDNKIILPDDRIVPRKALEDVADSPMMAYTLELIMAAMDSRGPYQSRECMLLAATLKGGKAFFIEANGISQKWKNHAGYILSLAGFERVSAYDKERKTPVKAWKSKHGWGHLSAEQRANEVYKVLEIELNEDYQPPQQAEQSVSERYL